MPVTELLEELRVAFGERGRDVDRHLQPGMSREEILEPAAPLGLTLPDDLIEMYEWRNGQDEDADMSEDALVFRDNGFIDLERALGEYATIQEHYSSGPDTIRYGFELRAAFPFAEFMGSWHAVVCGKHSLEIPDAHPVINVFHDLELFFYSVDAMLRTCIEWVRHPDWDRETAGLPEDVELEIWRKHNPGIFPR
jgi:hypothetical protein